MKVALLFSAFALAFAAKAPLPEVSEVPLLGAGSGRIPPLALSWGTVKDFNPASYAGRWYQVQESAASAKIAGASGDIICSHTDYTLLSNGTISVSNYGQRKATGNRAGVKGIAYSEDASKPAALTLELFGATPFPTSYDIVSLGPVQDGLYQWAVVTDPFRAQLYVLVRSHEAFANDPQLRAQVEVATRRAGFIFPWNSPKDMQSGEGCDYVPVPPPSDAPKFMLARDTEEVVQEEGDMPEDMPELDANMAMKFSAMLAPKTDKKMLGDAKSRRIPPTSTSVFVESFLEAEAYTGRWYQVLGNFVSSKATRLSDGEVECSTADYGLLPNGTISIFNSGQRKSDQTLTSISGIAYAEDADKPAALAVELFGGAPFPVAYDIAKLGPKVEGKYQWSIVTDPVRLFLFVLVRDYEKYQNDGAFRNQVDMAVKRAGFIFPWNKPYVLKQGEGCKYAPLPTDKPDDKPSDKPDDKKDDDNDDDSDRSHDGWDDSDRGRGDDNDFDPDEEWSDKKYFKKTSVVAMKLRKIIN